MTSARREVAAFGLLVAALTAATTCIAVSHGADLNHLDDTPVVAQLALFGTGFVPGLAAIIARRGVRGFGWGFGDSRYLLWPAWALPIVCCLLAYGAAWGTGLAEFDAGALGLDKLAALTLGLIPFGLLALGEEVGWRGLLVPRLNELTTPPRAALISGLAWAAFHLPLILFVTGGSEGVAKPLAVLFFTVTIVAVGVPLAWLRMQSRSLWPPVLLHASWNAAVYFVCDPLTGDGGHAWATGETGLFLALATPLVCAWWMRHIRSEGWNVWSERDQLACASGARP